MENYHIVCFTGHRQIPFEDREELKAALHKELVRQIGLGCSVFRAGGALGFDTMAALEVLELKKLYPHIRLELVLPCPTQTEKWQSGDVAVYQSIFEKADSHRFVSPYYFNGILQMRNQQLVDGADVCIAYLRNSHGGGTAQTVALALRSGLKLVNLYESVGW